MNLGLAETASTETMQPKRLMTQREVVERKEELAKCESMLNAPPHLAPSIDRAAAGRQARAIRQELHQYAPKPLSEAELDRAAKREQELAEEIKTGMLTHAEMRRAPAGAVERHMAWERKNKARIQEWKNLRLRQQVSGFRHDGSVSNIEELRPRGTPFDTGDALIPQTRDFHFPRRIEAKNVMDDEDKERMRAELIAQLSMLAEKGDKRATAALAGMLLVPDDPTEDEE